MYIRIYMCMFIQYICTLFNYYSYCNYLWFMMFLLFQCYIVGFILVKTHLATVLGSEAHSWVQRKH